MVHILSIKLSTLQQKVYKGVNIYTNAYIELHLINQESCQCYTTSL